MNVKYQGLMLNRVLWSKLLLALLMLIASCKKDERQCSCRSDVNSFPDFDSSSLCVTDTGILNIASNTDTTIRFGNSLQFISPVIIGATYSWEPSSGLSCSNCPNPIATPEASTAYILTIIDSIGFHHYYQAFIQVSYYPSLYIPNIFTPNGDGVNDLFYVYGREIEEFNLQVKDGDHVVFTTNDLNVGWDGTVNGNPIAECSNFQYIVDITFNCCYTYHAEGSVTIFNNDGTSCPENLSDCRFGAQFDGCRFNPNLPFGEVINC